MKLQRTPIIFLFLGLVTLLVTIAVTQTHRVIAQEFDRPSIEIANQNIGLLQTCGIRPQAGRTGNPELGPVVEVPAALYRFRRPVNWQNSAATGNYAQPSSVGAPREYQAIANRTNYGQRYLYDFNGRPVTNTPIVVLHETAATAQSTINFFQTYHTDEDDQASYHTLITLNGDVVYIVPPDLRAYGAGNSVFQGEAVQTDAKFPPSVNNFAYHVSLETPPDGLRNGASHSGYTTAQYQSLAWLVAQTGVPEDRITTHQAVDRSGERSDPRRFDQQLFLQLLRRYPRTQEIVIGCQAPSINQ
ncbi:N-acetylmuramoyl-L-alanine amidase family protein [Lyngbya aestuarii BL J]|uniref:N-acetylmuramoyl-L-alanine amidase n=1 Tax=Lyngbya aestuarii BL J TaxID=1348334 RepID=U7QPN6_9CYAN|nr:peptidoglycan recognition family protein [Lyngbya aestuarii]ERT09853.1 N-acetylmuramoyl-L-alanine amidase family protein [Lyngbya aestuarii BL J]